MTRLARSLVLAAILLSFPLSANAAGISVTNVSSSGASTAVLAVGDVLTVDLVVNNATNLDIFGLGLLVTGYDEDRNGMADSGLVFHSGAVTASALNTASIPGPPLQVFGGLNNVRTEPVEVWNFDPFDHESLRLSIFEGAATTSSNGDGGTDIGVDGALTSTGDVHFRVSFMATSLLRGDSAAFNLIFGIDPEYGAIAVGEAGSSLPFANDTVYTTVVPEPGTALLFGLGIAGLASTRRR